MALATARIPTTSRRLRPLSRAAQPARETPPDVLRWLRALSPRLDCYYLGEGRWGIVELQDDTARRMAGQVLRGRARTPVQRLVADLMADGFSLLMTVEAPEPTTAILPRLRDILTASEQAVARALAEAEAVSAGDERREADARQRDDWKDYEVRRHQMPFIFRGRRSFSNAGRPRG